MGGIPFQGTKDQRIYGRRIKKGKMPDGSSQVQPERVAAIILAAGGARRLGRPKQLLPFGRGTLLQHVLEMVLASPVDRVVLVLGAYAEEIKATLQLCQAEPRLRIVENPLWEMGLSSSLRAGLAALEPDIAAALLVLADQPNITADLIARLLAERARTGARLVAPAYRGERGNPVLFERTLFAELAAVTGDQGGRQVVAKHEVELATVEVTTRDAFLDIDTLADYEGRGEAPHEQ